MSIDSYLFGGTTRQLVYKSLDATAKRGRAINQNIANVTTEGYNKKEVHFEELVQRALNIKVDGNETKQNHLEISKKAALDKIKPVVSESNDLTLPGEVNNVDIDMEMSKLAENQIHYQYAVRFAGFSKFESAINGRAQ